MSTESLDRFLEAEKLLKLGKNDEAFHLFAKFIQDESCNLPLRHKNELARAFNERGYIQYLRVDFQSAIEDYSEAIALDEDFAVAYYNRGLVQYRLGALRSVRTAEGRDSSCVRYRLIYIGFCAMEWYCSAVCMYRSYTQTHCTLLCTFVC